jgi:phosphoglycerate dehydrogenase-like enzyme
LAQGQVVDEPALITALREKRIEGAAIEVFGQESRPYISWQNSAWSHPKIMNFSHQTAMD